MSVRKVLAYFVIGGIAGTLLDRIHTYFGVLAYAHPFVCGEAWWVPLIMGTASVALVVGYKMWCAIFGEERGGGTDRDVIIASVWFAAVYLASGLAKDDPIALTIAFTATFLARALDTPASRAMWAHAATAAVVGTLVEFGLTHIGAFRYLHPNAAGLPYWIGALYLHAGLLGRAVERRFGG
jgi:mannose/fructose/N-acetylgalactosamine-specific phosphotransferase system component IIC